MAERRSERGDRTLQGGGEKVSLFGNERFERKDEKFSVYHPQGSRGRMRWGLSSSGWERDRISEVLLHGSAPLRVAW
eukprot:1977687-Rhodomonas_salina.1